MTYRVSIICDVKKGNSLEKLPCESLRGGKTEHPDCEHDGTDGARRVASRRAKALGWIHKRRQGRKAIWICPACQVPD